MSYEKLTYLILYFLEVTSFVRCCSNGKNVFFFLIFVRLWFTFKLKLQLLLRKKAAEELKKEQERKAAERRRIIEERCGKPKDVDNANEGNLLLFSFEHISVINA